jgi:hypothetical protein
VALPGYIFTCSKQTFPECIDRMLMGGPGNTMRSLNRIVPEWTQLFLYDKDDKQLYGIFEATQRPAMNIVPDAWTREWPLPAGGPLQNNGYTRFPAQCIVRMAVFCPNSVPVHAFRHLLTQTPRGFRSELTLGETQSLIACFGQH